jgi:hypothetical protein
MSLFHRGIISFALTCLLALSGLAAAQQQQGAKAKPERAIATFAGGCFWCMEPPYDKLPGVLSTTSGYMGGRPPIPPTNRSRPVGPDTPRSCRWSTTHGR